jgi:hypothetical protein
MGTNRVTDAPFPNTSYHILTFDGDCVDRLFVLFIGFTAWKMYVHKFRRIGAHPHTNYIARDGAAANNNHSNGSSPQGGNPPAIELQSLQKQSSSSHMYGGNGMASLRSAAAAADANNGGIAVPSSPSSKGVTNNTEPMLV